MIYTKLTKRAMQISYAAHKCQKDKAGIPYVFHPMHLAEQMKDETTTVVALLHDVVEDTQWTLENLRQEGFPEEVLESIALLTKQTGITTQEYYNRIKLNSVAKIVKLADLYHNSDMSRLNVIDDESQARYEDYKEKTRFLKEE